MSMLNPKRHRLWRLAALWLCCSPLSAAVARASEADPRAATAIYRAPLYSEPVTLDPARYSDIYSMQVGNQLYDNLVGFDDQLSIVPALARRWKISRDHRTYSFLLRDDVQFHHGRRVDAYDVVFSLTRLLDPRLASPVAGLFSRIEGATAFRRGEADGVAGLMAKGSHQLEIRLVEPYAPFLSILAMANAKILPRDGDDALFDRRPIGSGPFQFSAWLPHDRIELIANKHYYGGVPPLDKLQFRLYANVGWEAMYGDFQRRQIDHTVLPSEHTDQFSDPAQGHNDAHRLLTSSGLNLVYIGFNQRVAPLDNPKVRQALSHSVDRRRVVQTITRRNSILAQGIIPPGLMGYEPQFNAYPYDPERAARLLAEAGYPQGKGIAPLQIWTASSGKSVLAELQAYVEAFAHLGIEAKVISSDWKGFIAAINAGEAALFYAAWYADYPDPDNFFFPLFHSQSPTNRMRFSDEEVDRLVALARTETDYNQRVEHYRQLNRLVMAKAPMIPQHINSHNYLVNANIRGMTLNPLGIVYTPFGAVEVAP